MNDMSSFNFCNYLAEGNIICQTPVKTGEEIITKLAERLAFNTAGLNKDEILEKVHEREALMPTVVAPGLAIPHARMSNVENLLIAVATSENGIDFNTPEMGPVRVVALIVTPADDPGLHLQVVAALAKMLLNPEMVIKMSKLESPGAIIDFCCDSKMELPAYLRVRDLMDRNPVILYESDTLNTCIATIAANHVDEIPVLDEEGDLRGVVSAHDILRFSLPEHILWMDDLTPILRFQPFAEMLKNAQDTKLADFMRESFESIDEDAPAVQLVKLFIVSKAKQVIVTNAGRFSGVVKMDSVIRDLFWA